jgi:hypothetical protein
MRLQVALLLLSMAAHAQHSPIGKWKTIDDNTGKECLVAKILLQKTGCRLSSFIDNFYKGVA